MASSVVQSDHDQWLRSLSASCQTLADGALDRPIDHIDGWSIGDLVAHLGAVYAFATANIEAVAPERTMPGTEASAPAGETLGSWFGERRDALLGALDAADPTATMWNFAEPDSVAWWSRRMAHETAVHLWDLEAATYGTDAASPIDRALAVDGIDEYAEVGLRYSTRRPDRIYPDASLHLHCTDGEGEWMFARGDTEHDVVVTHEHAKGDAAVRGSASSLALWIWGRPATGLELFGDTAVATAWQALAP